MRYLKLTLSCCCKDGDGARVIDVCGGRPAMLAAATGESVTFSMVVSFDVPVFRLAAVELLDRLARVNALNCFSSATAAAMRFARPSRCDCCDDEIRERFVFGSSKMLLYMDAADDDVGINEMPEPIPKFRANNSTCDLLN